MIDDYDRLSASRDKFNEFCKSVVEPLVGLTHEQMDDLGFVETAKRIVDATIRNQYCKLAVALLDENIRHHRPDATPIPIPKLNNTMAIVSTLFAAALAYDLRGTVVALLVSGAWYYMAAETIRRRTNNLMKTAEEHNSGLELWAEAIQGWEAEREELRLL